MTSLSIESYAAIGGLVLGAGLKPAVALVRERWREFGRRRQSSATGSVRAVGGRAYANGGAIAMGVGGNTVLTHTVYTPRGPLSRTQLLELLELVRSLSEQGVLPGGKRSEEELAHLTALIDRHYSQEVDDEASPLADVGRHFDVESSGSVPPDLLEITENQDTGRAVRHLAVGFDELFRALGPPPDGLAELEPTGSGDGGTER